MSINKLRFMTMKPMTSNLNKVLPMNRPIQVIVLSVAITGEVCP